MAVALHEAGLFAWPEWTEALSREIAAPPPSSDHDPDDLYYRRWLAALETLLVEKGAASLDTLRERRAAWARAAEATPHGRPILLANAPKATPGAGWKDGR